MTCPAHDQLAAATSGEAPDALDHAATCPRCASLIAKQRDLIDLARRLPAPVLPGARRAELAAETLARADDDGRYRGARIAVTASLVAAAAIALVIVTAHDRPPVRHAAITQRAAIAPALAHPVYVPAGSDLAPAPAPAVAPPLRSASIVGTEADFERSRVHDRDTIRLHDGTLVVDSRGRAPVSIVIDDTTIAVANSRARVVVVGGVIIEAQAFGAAVEMTTGQARTKIDAGEVWTPSPGPATSLAAFRAGWEALRAGRNADAIIAFDLATDPVVAEDAVFWAAVAATRAGDRAQAMLRLQEFLDRFPSSARADSARDALDNLTP